MSPLLHRTAPARKALLPHTTCERLFVLATEGKGRAALALLLLALFAFAVPAMAQRVRPVPPVRRPPPVVTVPTPGARPITFELDVPGKGKFVCTFDAAKNGKQWSQFANGTSKIAGVHLYTQSYRAGLTRCDVRISNASVNPDGSGFCGKIYFSTLSATGPPGSEIVTLARAGESVVGRTYTIIKALPAPSTNVLPPRTSFMRTFILASPGQRDAALAILNWDSLKIPEKVTKFGPLNFTFPTIDRPAADARAKSGVAGLRSVIASGDSFWLQDYANLAPPIGYVRLQGLKGGNDPGGEKIEFHQGDCQTRWAFVLREHMAQLSIEGRNYAAYNLVTGEPIRSGEWSSPSHQQNMNTTGEQIRELPAFMDEQLRYRVFNPQSAGTCPYEQELASIRKYDVAHSVRGMVDLICVIEIAGSQWAKDEFSMYYEDARIDWSNRPDDQRFMGPGEGYLYPYSLAAALYDAKAHPHIGHAHGDRACGWFAFMTAGMVKWFPGRTDVQVDADAMTDFIVTVADPFGIVPKNWTNPWDTYFPEYGTQGVQGFHDGIVKMGLAALDIQRHGKLTLPVLDVLQRGYKTLFGTFGTRDAYGLPSYPKWIATERSATPGEPNSWVHIKTLQGTYVSEEGDPVAAMPWMIGAILYDATSDMQYVNTPLKYWHPHATLVERRAWCKAQEFKSWSGAHEAVLERLSTNTLTRTGPTWE